MQTRNFFATIACAFMAVSGTGCGEADPGFDPVIHDPESIDAEYPPTITELNFQSDGQRLNGFMYLANGPGPHATVVLLHGFPGNEKNLDIAQALRRDGFNVLFFHYRGAWGSEGVFRFSHVVADVGAATEMLRTEGDRYRVDTDRIILIGHSMGGFAALQGAARDQSIRCVATVAAWDPGREGAAMGANAELAQGLAEYVESAQMLAGFSAAAAIEELTANAESFSLPHLAPALAGKKLLLIAGASDEVVPPKQYHDPMVAAYTAAPDIELTQKTLPGDHSFSFTRIELAQTLLSWLQSCGGQG